MGPYKTLLKDLPEFTGKVFAITGTTGGTGYVAASTAAKKGGTVLLLNRPSSRAEAALEKLTKDVPEGTFVAIDCDLQDFSSVRKACEEIKGKYSELYCLANNAGIFCIPDEATVDGYDKQMQTNHLSHFLLTAELFPLLEASAEKCGDACVVTMSGGARFDVKLEEKYLARNGGNLGGNGFVLGAKASGPDYDRACHSKLANSVFMNALHEKLQAAGKKVRSIGSQPGLVNSNLTKDWVTNPIGKYFWNFLRRMTMQTVEDGAAGLLTGMMLPDAKSGDLYGPENQEKGAIVANKVQEMENDPAAMKMLWEKSEDAVGVKFTV